MPVTPQHIRCHAHSSKTGKPCLKWAILGGKVCGFHGGRAPQVRDAARRRLEALVLPAIAELAKLIRQADSDSVRVSAIKDILDRAGYRLPDKIESESAVTIKVEYDSYPITDQVAHSNGKTHAL